jgi:hypothetical protein
MARGSLRMTFATLLALGAAAPSQSALAQDFPLRREVATKCRFLAFLIYPTTRPGAHSANAVRYALFKDCVDKGGDVTGRDVAPFMPPPPVQQASQPAPPASSQAR